MRLIIVLLIILVVSGLTWVGFTTWNQGAVGMHELLPKGAATADLDQRNSGGSELVETSANDGLLSKGLGPVQGRVVSPSGGPVVGARVSLIRLLSAWPEWRHEQIEAGVYTDDEGRFLLQTPRGDELMVEVHHENLATRWVPAPKELSSLMIRMEYGFEVKGAIRLRRGGRPVLVSLEPSSWSDNRAISVMTDSRGRFRFTNIRAGLARLSARNTLYALATLPTVTVGSEEELILAFRGRGGGQMVIGEVKLADAPNQPLVGAEVRVYPSTAWNSGLLEPFLTETDARGRFVVRGLGEGNLRVEVRHPEYSTISRIARRGRRSAPLSFEMLPKSKVLGRLAGTGLAGTRISLVSDAGEIGWARVDAEGNFAFSTLISAGRAILEIENGQWAFAESSSRYLDFIVREDGETRLDQKMIAPSVLSGRVVNADGDPLAGVMVSTLRRRAALRSPERLQTKTDTSGRYEFRGLVVGTVEVFMGSVELFFERTGYAPKYAAVVGAAQQPEVQLVKPGVIEGQVTRGGRPLPGAIIFAGHGKHHETTVVTGPDGRYRLDSLAPGSYRVKVRYSTLSLQLAEQLAEVRSGEVTGPIDIDFPRGKIVEGIILADNELPIAEASVLAIGDFGARIITHTDGSGSFMLEVPEGARELQVVSPDFQIFVQKEIREGKNQGVIHLPMVPRASIVTRVLGLPEGRPVTAGILRIEPLDDQQGWDENQRRQRDVPSRWVEMINGELRIGDFPAGRSRLTLQCPGFIPHIQEVNLRRNEAKVLPDIVLEPGARLRGLVTNVTGEAIVGAVVHLGEELDLFQFGARTSYRTDAAGEFEIRGVAPLGKRLVVYAEGYAIAVIDLEFPSDLMRRDPKRIVLQLAASITVAVKNADGQPQSSGWVILLRDGVRLALAEPDEDGVVTFIARGAGTYRVALLGREEESQEVVITDQSRELSVKLMVGGQ